MEIEDTEVRGTKNGVLGQTWEELVDQEEYCLKENLFKLMREIDNLDKSYNREQEEYSKSSLEDELFLNLLDEFDKHKTGKYMNSCQKYPHQYMAVHIRSYKLS